jgi:hypothetical protein
MYPFAKNTIVNFAASLDSPAVRTEPPTAEELGLAARIARFLQDLEPTVKQTRAAYANAIAGIAYNHKWGQVYDPLGYKAGGVLPRHSQVLAERAATQRMLQFLVPAQRLARRLIHQLQHQPGCANFAALEEHLLSHAYQLPREVLFYQHADRLLSRSMRHKQLTLTLDQAVIARELLARFSDLFAWGPKFAAAYPNIPTSSTSA